MKRAVWIGPLLVAALIALAAWLGSGQPQPASQREPSAQAAPDTRVGQQPARSPLPAQSADDRRSNTSPGARAPSPGQALHEVEALVDQGKIGAARDLAELYLPRMPAGPEAARIQSLTGVHPHR
jgi:hypothetical protein